MEEPITNQELESAPDLIKTTDKCTKCGKPRSTNPANQQCDEADCPIKS